MMANKKTGCWFAGKGFPQVVCWLLYAFSFFWGLVLILSYMSLDSQRGVETVPAFLCSGITLLISPFIMVAATKGYSTKLYNRIGFAAAAVLAILNIVFAIILLTKAVEPAYAYILGGIAGIVCTPGSVLLHILCLGWLKKVL